MPDENNDRIPLAKLVALRRAAPPPPADADKPSLADRFLLPPFSVLDARQGYWQKRKKMWIELGIQSELGRGTEIVPNGSRRDSTHDGCYQRGYGKNNGLLGFSEQARGHYRANATPGGSPLPAMKTVDGKTVRGDGRGRRLAATFGSGGPGDLAAGFRNGAAIKDHDWVAQKQADGVLDGEPAVQQSQSGTSIFDPVLCEIAYRWFAPAAGRVLDPFAGGSVRGIVAARLGRAYAGVDLRPEQAEANYAQMAALCPDADLRWVVGDSLDIGDLLPDEYDLLFSCPPYADLERYSDDPRDLSTMGYDAFLEAYRAIIAASCAMLRDDRFAVWVVGDVRDRNTGNYRGFVGDTIEAFRAAGLELYNEAVLVTSVGSLPIRVGRQFAGYRKLGKTHQNVLVFLKGDAGRAAAACGEVDVDDLAMPECMPGRVAVCAADVGGLAAEAYLEGSDGDLSDAAVLPPYPLVEACLIADIIRGAARAADRPPPRMWVGEAGGWRRVPDHADMTYLVGNTPYLNREVFPDAGVPMASVPVARRMRGAL